MDSEMKTSIEEIKQIKRDLVNQFKKECCEIDNSNVQQLGLLSDMIKDMSEIEKNCLESCYYKTVVEAMEEADDEDERYGYNSRRYSSGQYAPKGRGHMGYNQTMKQMPYIDGYLHDPNFMNDMAPMGYNEQGGVRTSKSRYGYHYDKWQQARENGNKTEMKQSADRHLKNMKESVKEMWLDADPDLRQQMKTDMTALLNELK